MRSRFFALLSLVVLAAASVCAPARADDYLYSCRQLHDMYRAQIQAADAYQQSRDAGKAVDAKLKLAIYNRIFDAFDGARVPVNLNSSGVGCDDETIFFQDEASLMKDMIQLGTGREERTRSALENAYVQISNMAAFYAKDRASDRYDMLLRYARRVNAWCDQEHVDCYDWYAWSHLKSWPEDPPRDQDGQTIDEKPF